MAWMVPDELRALVASVLLRPPSHARSGLPFATLLTATEANESVVFEQVLDAIPPISPTLLSSRPAPLAPQQRSMSTTRTKSRTVGATFGRTTSAAGSRGSASSRAIGRSDTAGRWSGRGIRTINSVGCACATNNGPICITRSSRSPQRDFYSPACTRCSEMHS